MKREDYRKKAELLAELLHLTIKEGDFSKTDEYLQDIAIAIKQMREQPQ